MGVLRSIEHRIESVVEGIFGRAFRSHVQPVELARKLAREMDEHKTVSVSRIYVPNEYVVYLAPQDRRELAQYESALVVELGDYLSEHARREGYAMLSQPKVQIEEDADLHVGEFGIATRAVQPPTAPPTAPPEPAPAPPPVPEPPQPPGDTQPYTPEPEPTPEPPPPPPPPPVPESEPNPPPARVFWPGNALDIVSGTIAIGRSKECEILLDDQNASRRHAEIRAEGLAWYIVNLGSTNGVELNGNKVERARLGHGDKLILGKTEVIFELLE